MNFIYFIRLFTLLSMKLNVVVNDVNLDTLYGLIKITSSSSTTPPLFNFFICSLFLYNSWIFQILLSTYWFPHSLYISNSSASILWIWNTQFSMLFWIKYCKSSNTPRILVAFMVQLLMLIFKIVSSISIIVVLACSSWNIPWPISFEILKGPYLFWSNFFEGQFEWIFLLSSHMLFPTFNPWGFLLFLLNCFFIFFWASSIDFVASS